MSWRAGNVPLPEASLTAIGIGVALHRVRPWTLPGPRLAHRVLGGSLLAAAGWMLVRAVRTAGQVELERPAGLVTTGPYAVSRNPMYVGWTLLHLGAGLVARSGWMVTGVPVAAWWTHREVLREEDRLRDAFGEQYERYRRTTRRYW